MIRFTGFLFFFLLGLGGCTTVLLTKVEFSDVRSVSSKDSTWTNYRREIAQHYDSVSKVKQKVRDAIGDPFVETRVNTFQSDVDTSRVIVIATITGDAVEEDYEWLVYKMKKQALLKGGNLIASFNSEHYTRYGFGYFLMQLSGHRVPDEMRQRVKCTGKVVYVIPTHT
jgi:hypothetical protein